ncbi:MAG TPA: glycosyltransferase, partial [Planctomycetota bacterium]|nr:glycosyltransferase [Planctomycetota bacterium]
PWDFQPVGDDGPIPEMPSGVDWPKVVVIVPARNEAESLPKTLPALLKQEYIGKIHVIVVDDRSTDNTADVAAKLAFSMNKGDRFTVIRGKPLPEGWMGKVWAMHQGAQAALQMKCDYVLLTDADILHAPTSLWRLVSQSRSEHLALNSRMARLRCQDEPEKWLIPPFVFFFNLLYPMRRINNPQDKLAGAAGGCVLLSRDALQRIGPFECIKSEVIDDVNLARQVKKHQLPIALSLSRKDVVSLREYPATSDVWKMVRRTAFTELKYSYARLFGAMLGLGLIFIVPFIAILAGLLGVLLTPGPDVTLFAGWALLKGLLSVLVMRFVYAPAVRFFELPSFYAWTLPVAGVLYGMMTLDSARRHARGQGVQWRDAAQPGG